jgi:hypothetical protein
MSELKKTIKKIGFSDKFGVFSSIVVGIFCFCCLIIFTFTDKDPILFFTAALGFLGTQIGFLYSKNAKENVIKLGNSTSTFDSTSTVTTDTTVDTVTESTTTQG